MISLYNYICEATGSQVFLIKTAEECNKFLDQYINKSNTTLRDALQKEDGLGLSEDMINALYEYTKDKNMPSPIVGCYGNTKFNIALRRWFNEKHQKEVFDDGYSFYDCFNFNSKYFKGYHDTTLKEDGKYVPSASDFELIICFAYNKNYCKFDDAANASFVGIPKNKIEDIINYYNVNSDTLNVLVKTLEFVDKKHTGFRKLNTITSQISTQWSNFFKDEGCSVNATPKTDIISGDGKIKVSLKKAIGAQIMSAKAAEAKATLLFCINEISNKQKVSKEELHLIYEFLYQNLNIVTGDKKKQENFNEVFYEITADILGNRTLREFQEQNEEFVGKIKENGKSFQTKLNKLFDDIKDYKRAFLFEALTGTNKFVANSPSTANYVFLWDDVTLSDNYLYSVDEYCDYLMEHQNKWNVTVDFKSWPRSNKTAQTLKIITHKH